MAEISFTYTIYAVLKRLILLMKTDVQILQRLPVEETTEKAFNITPCDPPPQAALYTRISKGMTIIKPHPSYPYPGRSILRLTDCVFVRTMLKHTGNVL